MNAGIMLAGEGLHPSSKVARVKFSARKPTVVDGPFAQTNIEIRQVFEAEDFGAEFTPDARTQEERLRVRMGEKQ